MTPTPTPARRRAALAAGLVVLLVAVAGVAWRETRFAARHEALPDAPFDLLVQRGVSDAEVAAVRDGLRAADRYLRTRLGAGAAERVEVRLARSQGCTPFASPAGPPTADSAAAAQLRKWGVGDPAYALFHLATRYLDEQTARPTAMADFCRAVGQGRPWREAFAAAFGLPVDAFYARFAAARPGLIAGL